MTDKLDDTPYWNLSIYLSRIALPVLRSYRDDPNHGYPTHLDREQWNTELDKMIDAFELIIAREEATDWRKYEGDDVKERIKVGLRSFSDNFESLWN